jgi:hypothetical protein
LYVVNIRTVNIMNYGIPQPRGSYGCNWVAQFDVAIDAVTRVLEDHVRRTESLYLRWAKMVSRLKKFLEELEEADEPRDARKLCMSFYEAERAEFRRLVRSMNKLSEEATDVMYKSTRHASVMKALALAVLSRAPRDQIDEQMRRVRKFIFGWVNPAVEANGAVHEELSEFLGRFDKLGLRLRIDEYKVRACVEDLRDACESCFYGKFVADVDDTSSSE